MENVLFSSEQFQVEPGIESTSLTSRMPGIAGAGAGEPGSGGGIGGAHPWMLAEEACGVFIFKKSAISSTVKKRSLTRASFSVQLDCFYCERYSNGTLRRPGMRSLMARRKASTLLSPREKAIIEPIMTPQMPPSAMPSRNMRLRKNDIVDHLF